MKKIDGEPSAVKVLKFLRAQDKKGIYYTRTELANNHTYKHGFKSREWILLAVRQLISQGFIYEPKYGEKMRLTNKNIDEFRHVNLIDSKRKKNSLQIINILKKLQSENIYYTVNEISKHYEGSELMFARRTLDKLIKGLAAEGYIIIRNHKEKINVVMLTDKEFPKEV